MPVPDLEACIAFVFANRLVAEQLVAEAERLEGLVPTCHDPAQREELLAVIEVAKQRAALHISVAETQERDLGGTCHCPAPC